MPITKVEGKKDGKQKYRVRVNYTDSYGKAHQIERTAYGSAEAKQIEMQLKHQIKEKSAPQRMTVQQLFDEYIEAKRHEVRESTLHKSLQILTRDVLPSIKEQRLDQLNISFLQNWKNNVGARDLSIVTKQNIFKEFRTMLNYAVKMEYIAKNPLVSLGNFREVYFEKPAEKLHYYTPEQFLLYIKKAREFAEKDGSITGWGYYVFFNIAFYTGMRKGEINALKWSDIEGNTIHVRRSIAQKVKGGDRETPPKNKSSYRDLQAPEPLLLVLNEHLVRQQKIPGYSQNFRVCGSVRCLRDSSIDNRNRQFAEEAGLPHIRIHDFRHSHASLLANEGINVQEIARRLGHSNIEITWNTYSHLYPREEERAVKILDRIR